MMYHSFDLRPLVLSHPQHLLPHRSHGTYIQKSGKLNPTTDKEVSLPGRIKLIVCLTFYTCSASLAVASRSVHIFAFNVCPEELDAAHTLLDKSEGRRAMRLDLS